MQHDYCSAGGALAKLGLDLSQIQQMTPRLRALLRAARADHIYVIHVRTEHHDWTSSRSWRARYGGRVARSLCRPGTWGAEFVKGCEPRPAEPVVVKHRYSAFVNTDLDLILRSVGVRILFLTGATTNICVESTARDAFMRDYEVVVVQDCTGATEPDLYAAALKNIRYYFGKVVSAAEARRIWRTP
jgi:ureidoacrylate peracid hydrolase